MIYYDQTESSTRTRLTDKELELGKTLTNLEHLTGADMLITPHPNMPTSLPAIDTTLVGEVLLMTRMGKSAIDIAKETGVSVLDAKKIENLWLACQSGILVQRKSENDYISSITKLDEIFGRMKLWTPDPWLLITGNFGCNRDGKVTLKGKASGMSYRAIVNKMASWQFLGGRVIHLARDGLIYMFLEYADRKLTEFWQGDYTKFVTRQDYSRQAIIGVNNKDWTGMRFIAGLPGIGNKKVKDLFSKFDDPAEMIQFLTDYDLVEGMQVGGIGKGTVKNIRRMLGLRDDEKIMIVKDNDND